MKLLSTLVISVFASSAWALVDVKNATYNDTWTDHAYSGTGFDLKFVRSYRSRSLSNGMLGFGWCTNFETTLEKTPENTAIVTECGDGLETVFLPKGAQGSDMKKVVEEIIREARKKERSQKEAYFQSLREQLVDNAKLRYETAKKFGVIKETKEVAEYISTAVATDILKKVADGYQRQLPDGTSQKFNTAGKLTHVFDRNGNFLKINYRGDVIADMVDNNGRKLTFQFHSSNKKVKQISGPGNVKSEYTFDANSNLISAVNSDGKFSYEYDDLHNLTKVTFPDKTTKSLTYDKNRDWVTSLKDRSNCKEDYTYTLSKDDPKNHYSSGVTKVCDGKVTAKSHYEFWYKEQKDTGSTFLSKITMDVNGDKTETQYHEKWGKPIVLVHNGKKTIFEYNEQGLIKTRQIGKEMAKFRYDNPFNKVSQVTIGSRVTNFEYDEKGNPKSAKNSSGQYVKLEYDRNGRVASIVDQAKRHLNIKYDEQFGRTKLIERPGVGSIRFTYKSSGEVDKFDPIPASGGEVIASQVLATFNNVREIFSPGGVDLGF